MGTWGPGLFSDDLACDIRDEYRELIGDGLQGPEATDRLITDFASDISDSDSGTVFWLTLASTQWKCGRLEERVKTKALEIIETGVDLQRWKDDPKLLKKREITLNKLHSLLLSEQPKPAKIKKSFKQHTLFSLGDIFSYSLRSGKFVLFRVVNIYTGKGGTAPEVELLDWVGDMVPSTFDIWLMHAKCPIETWRPCHLLLYMMKERDFPIERVGIITKQPLIAKQNFAATGIAWTHLDRTLQEWFGLE